MKRRLLILSVLAALNTQGNLAEVRFPPETQNAALRYWMAFAEMQDPPADKIVQDLLDRACRRTSGLE